ncbi:MAG TPA: 3-hydroxyacyl-CoA dehydrogenase NAD-binding domain-containing protein [Chthoniobacteraceae bacterium]|nr:3-hydroxyacyl-CoA dehydrogenase NAD-binding domain-containing protein [Chthoniobacteraceae bacterium]
MNEGLQLTMLGEGIARLTFDQPGKSANTFDEAVLEALDAQLEALEQQADLRGVVIDSAKPTVFMAGADLDLFRSADPERLDHLLALGQRVFNRLEALPVPTVAMIHGACLGGGYEMALACDYRIATPDKATRIGLPETQLGIVPAWGGTTRLPRLVGVPTALKVILKGKRVPAREALRLGMVDEVVPHEWLLKAAVRVLLGDGKREPLHKRHIEFYRRPINLAVANVIARRSRAEVIRQTRGHYPAVMKALQLVIEGAGEREPGVALARERTALLELVRRPEAGNLFAAFMLTERARKRMKTEGHGASPVGSAAVIGAGVMGAGIAQWLSSRGVRVVLRDLDTQRVAAGMKRIIGLYQKGVKRRLLTEREAREGLERVAPAPADVPCGALRRVDLVIEAAVEELGAKQAIFRELDAAAPLDALLASNTSALPIRELAAAATEHARRTIGLHFFNPVASMRLVELVLPEGVEPEARACAFAFVAQIGKLALPVADRPGFLVNRVLMPYLMEAALAFEGGMEAASIDETMLAFGMPMGPLRLIDEIGLDVALDAARTLHAAFPERMALPPFLERMVAAGLLGRKVGSGFYEFSAPGGKGARPNPKAESFRGEGAAPVEPGTLRERMLYRMIDEAACALEEKVVASARDIDLGMMLGAGFPPFRGGLLRYADSVGIPRILQEMEAMNLKPCDLLYTKAAAQESFHENRNHPTPH